MLSLALLAVGASRASALSLGLQWTGDFQQAQAEMDVVGKSGATLFRLPLEPDRTAGGNDFSYYDAVVGNAAQNGVTLLPHFSERMNGEAGLPEPPEVTAWTEWAKKAVRRYGYNGVYWTSHPQVPYRPVIAWEMYNEPNNKFMNGGVIHGKEYGEFLTWAGPAVQGASESWGKQKTGVLFGGLLAWGLETNYQAFFANAYAVGGVPSAFTGLAFHPYILDPASFPGKSHIQALKESVNAARNMLNSAGATGKSLWITEMGWPAEAEYSLGEAGQAGILNESFAWLKANATGLNLHAVVWYNYRDINENIWQYRSGLRKHTGEYRQSWFAFQQQTGAPKWPLPSSPPVRATFVDAADQNTISGWERPSGGAWAQTYLWGQPVAAGSSPETLEFNGTKYIFYVNAANNNTISAWVWNPITGWQQNHLWGHPVAKGTSPVAVVANGVPHVFYVDASNNNTLTDWTWNSVNGWQQTPMWGHPVSAGSSPAAMMVNGYLEVFYSDAANSNSISVWVLNPSTGWGQAYLYGHPVAAGTSPSAVMEGSRPHVFFVDASNNNTLTDWTWNSVTGWQQTFMWGHPLSAGSSPAAMMVNGYLEVFYSDAANSNSISVWVLIPSAGWAQAFLYGHPLTAGTSPSAVMEGATPHVYFNDASNASTVTDWSWNSTTGWQQTFLWGHPLAAGSSPAGF